MIEETQTGYQNREPEHTIDESTLKSTFSHIETIADLQVLEFDMACDKNLSLDDGEKALIIYAHSIHQNIWFLNSPDSAAVKYACETGWGDRLISLEAMLNHLKFKSQFVLRQNFTETWLVQTRFKFIQRIF